MNSTNRIETLMVLSDGCVVPKPFYDGIKELVQDVLHVLIPGATYTAEMLCGHDFWDSLKVGEPALAGRCLMDMVRKNVLPLRRVGCQHQYPKRYTLK